MERKERGGVAMEALQPAFACFFFFVGLVLIFEDGGSIFI
jgi:hypothetical protein